MNVPYGTKVINDMVKKRGFFQNNLIRVSDLLSLLLGTRFPKSFPFVFVIAYPKSGHTWAGQLIADYLQLPAPQNTLLPIGHPAVLFTHHRVWKGFQRGVYVVRDGRDIMTSLFCHTPSWHTRSHLSGLGKKARDNNDIAAFVEWQFSTIKPASSYVNWPTHVRSYFEANNSNLILTKYEDLHREGEKTLSNIVSNLTEELADLDKVRIALDKYSFTKQTGRLPGQEAAQGTWARKGKVGDWINYFTPEAAEVFDHYAGDILIELGYEEDHCWVDSFRETSQSNN